MILMHSKPYPDMGQLKQHDFQYNNICIPAETPN